MSKRGVDTIKHSLSWFVLIIVPHVFSANPLSVNLLAFHTLLYVAPITIFYLHSEIILPYLFIKRRYLYYFSAVFILCGIFFFIFFMLTPILAKLTEMICAENPSIVMLQGKAKVISHFVIFFITLAASGMYGYSVQNAKREQVLKEMERQQAVSNLQLLKSQLSPHFLFNAMNSLYSLSLKKSEELPNAILTFSDLLRYNTYDSSEDFVNVEKEIEYLHNYVKIQKLRVAEGSTILFDEEIDKNASVQIAPMILVPFVENAFKHGRSAEGTVDIAMRICVTASEINFCISNKIFASGTKDFAHGIGIQNVKTRLQLIYGPKHHLEIQETETKYNVALKITI
ncbi:MAG: sensor histidine kinase [Bacteroidales bacterium]|nr:sensor histidine kinase [Bacteroidales bacterium]MBR7035043.1 sensor histidine kinase [Bacteroidales bacterium]